MQTTNNITDFSFSGSHGMSGGQRLPGVTPPFRKLLALSLKGVDLFSEPCGSQEGTSSMPLPSAITK